MTNPIIHPITTRAPEFPCWLWSVNGWAPFSREVPSANLKAAGFTHWSPDAPEAPADGPDLSTCPICDGGPGNECACSCPSEPASRAATDAANAAFIVLACNEHDRLVADNARLVEALQALLETDCPNKQYIHGHPFAELARTALATAVSAAPADGAQQPSDKEMLDWLQNNYRWVLCAETEPEGTFSMGSNRNFQTWASKISSVRQAIASAMKGRVG